MRITRLAWGFDRQISPSRILQAIERAGRTCYRSEDRITDESAEAFVRMIVKSGHHSVLEHQSITVWVRCSRGMSHEIVRHRLAAYSQESTRYCNYAKKKFEGQIRLIPYTVGLTYDQIKRRRKLYQHMEYVYLQEIAEGVKPQQARDNLPICLKTKLYITYNLRQWRHFFALRTPEAAHPQLRQITRPMLRRFQTILPAVFEDVGIAESKREIDQKRLAGIGE